MKTFKTKHPIPAKEIKIFLDKNLGALFEQKRQLVLQFNIVLDNDALEITNDKNYDSFLFRIEINGTEILVTKSEHYTDDVNVLALEDILNRLFLEFPEGDPIKYTGGEN